VSVHEVKPVRLSTVVRRVWKHLAELNPSVYSLVLVPPYMADVSTRLCVKTSIK